MSVLRNVFDFPVAVTSKIKVIVEGFYNPNNNSLNITDTIRAYLRNRTAPFDIVDYAIITIDRQPSLEIFYLIMHLQVDITFN